MDQLPARQDSPPVPSSPDCSSGSDMEIDRPPTPDNIHCLTAFSSFPDLTCSTPTSSDESALLRLDSEHLRQIAEEFQHLDEASKNELSKLPHCGSTLFVSATMRSNYHKNRYSNVLAAETSRVKLRSYMEAGLDTDYINANFIAGEIPGSEQYYISCQAPLPGTMFHFWLMVWEQRSYVILMLTRLVERNRVKASIYWPTSPGEEREFGDIVILHKETKNLNDVLAQRTFIITRGGESREVIQFHYTEWPDFGIPSSTETIRELARRMDLYKEKGKSLGLNGPVIAHCSAGIGRTGTFIAFHITLEKMKYHQSLLEFNIQQTVLALRRSRSGMVQTEEQYQFIYLSVRDAQRELAGLLQKPVFGLPLVSANGTKTPNVGRGMKRPLGETVSGEKTHRIYRKVSAPNRIKHDTSKQFAEKRRRLCFSSIS